MNAPHGALPAAREAGREAGRAAERGSVMVLLIGLVAVVLLLVGVVTDASVLFLTKRSLAGVADGAALAGAQTIDEEVFYTAEASSTGDAAFIPLDAELTRAAVRDYLQDSAAARGLDGFVVEQIEVTGRQVSVRLIATADLPFRKFVGGGKGLVLQAEASAETPFR